MADSTDTSAILLPEQVGPLVVQPFIDAARATQVATVISTGAPTLRLPIVQNDPAAAWTAEGAEIAPSDLVTDEEVVTPAKIAAIVPCSSELVEDSSPEASQVVGQGLVRDLARKADAAFFGSLASPAPPGLESLVDDSTPPVPIVGTVDAGASWTNLDPFAQAISQAESEGAVLTSFCAHPDDALALAQLKTDSTDSNQPLLGTDPAKATQRTIYGVPLFTSRSVTAGTVWGIPKADVYVAMRKNTRVVVDRSVYFTRDKVAVRAIMRIAYGFPHPLAVQKITLSA